MRLACLFVCSCCRCVVVVGAGVAVIVVFFAVVVTVVVYCCCFFCCYHSPLVVINIQYRHVIENAGDILAEAPYNTQPFIFVGVVLGIYVAVMILAFVVDNKNEKGSSDKVGLVVRLLCLAICVFVRRLLLFVVLLP